MTFVLFYVCSAAYPGSVHSSFGGILICAVDGKLHEDFPVFLLVSFILSFQWSGIFLFTPVERSGESSVALLCFGYFLGRGIVVVRSVRLPINLGGSFAGRVSWVTL